MALNTEKCNAWVERDKKVFAPTQHLSYYPMVIKKVDQDVIYDEDDNQYIDFLSSASSLNLGSCNPIITAAVKEQLDNYSQYTIAYTYGRKSIEYAERLTSVYPGGVPAKIVFGNCGSDANDAAVKFARAYTGRSKIITFINAYHGSTYGSISMSMVTTRMRAKMGPMLPDIYCFPFYDVSYDDETCEKECIADIERAFATYLPAEEIIPRGENFHYVSKNQKGGAQEICPPPNTEEEWHQSGEMALKLHRGLGLSVYSRSDFLLDEEGKAWCLEINTLPGMTPTSLVPQEAAAVGIGYGALCQTIVEASLKARKGGA